LILVVSQQAPLGLVELDHALQEVLLVLAQAPDPRELVHQVLDERPPLGGHEPRHRAHAPVDLPALPGHGPHRQQLVADLEQLVQDPLRVLVLLGQDAPLQRRDGAGQGPHHLGHATRQRRHDGVRQLQRRRRTQPPGLEALQRQSGVTQGGILRDARPQRPCTVTR
jgi:hypothetical protein